MKKYEWRDQNQLLHGALKQLWSILSDPSWSSFASPAEDAKRHIGPPNGSRQFPTFEGHHSLAHPLPCCYRRCLQVEPLRRRKQVADSSTRPQVTNESRNNATWSFNNSLNQDEPTQTEPSNAKINQDMQNKAYVQIVNRVLWYYEYTMSTKSYAELRSSLSCGAVHNQYICTMLGAMLMENMSLACASAASPCKAFQARSRTFKVEDCALSGKSQRALSRAMSSKVSRFCGQNAWYVAWIFKALNPCPWVLQNSQGKEFWYVLMQSNSLWVSLGWWCVHPWYCNCVPPFASIWGQKFTDLPWKSLKILPWWCLWFSLQTHCRIIWAARHPNYKMPQGSTRHCCRGLGADSTPEISEIIAQDARDAHGQWTQWR